MTAVTKRPPWILPVIVLSQFAGTSLWFAGNAVLGDLQREWGLPADSLGYITSAVQFGFICGTLVFAFFMISDRASPRRVFFVEALPRNAMGKVQKAELRARYQDAFAADVRE